MQVAEFRRTAVELGDRMEVVADRIDERLSIKELGYGLRRMVELLKTIGTN